MNGRIIPKEEKHFDCNVEDNYGIETEQQKKPIRIYTKGAINFYYSVFTFERITGCEDKIPCLRSHLTNTNTNTNNSNSICLF